MAANPNSAYSILCDGLREAGKSQRGSEPDSELLADGMRRLNDIINVAQTQGIKLWLQFDLAVPLVAGQGVYSLGPGGSVNMTKPLRVLDSCYYLDSNNLRRPLSPLLSRDDYARLSNPTQQGPVNQLFPDKQQSQLVVTFWLVPDAQAATGTAHLLIQQQVTNFVNLTDDMNFPNEWRLFLVWAIADEMCTGAPQAVQDRCSKKALTYFDALNNWDSEDASTIF